MSTQKPARAVLSIAYGLLCFTLLLSLAAADGIGSSIAQASPQDISATYLPMVTKYLTDPLDDSFGDGGKVFTDIGDDNGNPKTLAIQDDGKVILAGSAQFAYEGDDLVLLRYNPDGSLDTTFDGDGAVITNLGGYEYGYAIAIQPDGKIVLAGYSIVLGELYSDCLLARYNPDGSLDNSFGGDGIVISTVGKDDMLFALALQPDGKIVAAGKVADNSIENEDLLVVRYESNGDLDSSFGGDGVITTSYGSYEGIESLAVQSDGKIVASGVVADDLAVLRYLSDGTLDTGFSEDGLATVDVGGAWNDALDITIQPDGKILISGVTDRWTDSDSLLARFSTDGSLDTSLGGDGIVEIDQGQYESGTTLALLSDGRIMVGGMLDYDFTLLCYLPDGSLDSSFAKGGILTVDFFGSYDWGMSLAVQSDGKVVLGGSARNAENVFFAMIRTK